MNAMLMASVISVHHVKIQAAASLRESLTAAAAAFEKAHPDVDLELSFGGSQQWANAIKLGAPADIFISADRAQMLPVVQAGKTFPMDVHPYVRNRMVIAVSRATGSQIRSLRDLAAPGVRIAICAKNVPAGAYAREVIAKAGRDLGSSWLEGIQQNIVTEDPDVRHSLARVELGQADAAFVYSTDAATDPSRVAVALVDAKYAPAISYRIAALRTSDELDVSRHFVAYLLSGAGLSYMRHAGFLDR